MIASTKSVITGAGHAFPSTSTQEELWGGFFRSHFDDNAIARRMFAGAGVTTRHAVINPLVEDVSRYSTAERMSRYVSEAKPLAVTAVQSALATADIDARDIGMFVVVSCTGYASPGLDTLVATDVDMRPEAQRLVIGHMGCFAALPGLAAASDYVRANEKPALLLSVELASLHVQPPTNDVEQIVAHSLFSDAASSLVVSPGEANDVEHALQLVDVAVQTFPRNADLMTWHVTDLGFRMTLSQKIPDVLSGQVRPLVDDLLARNNVSRADVVGWAAHPGGPRILDVVADDLELKPDALDESRRVLSMHGNCSSATVLLVLDEIRKRKALEDGYVVALAFGPGLTLYSALLRTL